MVHLRDSRQPDYVTSKQFCQFHGMIAEKNTSYSTASNVDLIRGSNSEGVGREIGHEPSVRNGERRCTASSSQTSPCFLSVAARFCSLFPTATAAVPHFLFISQPQLPGLHHGSLFYFSLVPLLSLWYAIRPTHHCPPTDKNPLHLKLLPSFPMP